MASPMDSQAKFGSLNTHNENSTVKKPFNPKGSTQSTFEMDKGYKTGNYIGQNETSSYSLPRRTHRPKIPPWMSVTFRPPEDMIQTTDELACVAYIFGPDLKSETTKGEEMLVSTITSYVNREGLSSLVPGEQVHQEQLALSWSRPPDQLQKQFADHYMDKVDNLSRIFVPINDLNEHWFLMIIDMKKGQLIVLSW
ncbi:hypothetical protein PIB30_052640 [Stylosanthes scabra]|uniref:Ubiquitin-like protease family profile domain-containing protein n=1 Tax=Stylosanthes scabra TaxID=79078 RepID=A0ABU6XFZ1_9FABA|nr:hypothetical protein [Stylosanthes scabra]